MQKGDNYEQLLDKVNTSSRPTDLRITDVRFADVVGAPMHCTLMKVMTNQGLEGYGEVRDGANRLYAEMLISRIIGQNPCEIDKIFRRIKQFGGQSRQGGGVCGIELALWDIAGKAYGMPVYQMLGGKFRDSVRVYCDTDSDSDDGVEMGKRLKERMNMGYTFLKMDLGINLLYDVPGALNAPMGLLEKMRSTGREAYKLRGQKDMEARIKKAAAYDMQNVMHFFTGIQVTEKGLDILEKYVADVRSVIGYEIPLAIDHFGHIGVDSAIRLGRRIEKYNIAWMEDLVPWQMTEQYVRMNKEIAIPIATGEDIFLKESFEPLIKSGGVSVIHPDLLTSGGIYENKKIGDMAQDYGVAMAVHMAESPITCLAAAHSVAATENFLAQEFHSVDVPWWQDMVYVNQPIVENGFIKVPEEPGLGIKGLNDEVIKEHLHPDYPEMWATTEQWAHWESNDRLWS